MSFGLRYVLLFIYFLFTNVYLYIIAIYDDATARHDGGERLRLRKVGPNDVSHRSGLRRYVLFLFCIFILTYIYIIVHSDDAMAHHNGGDGLMQENGPERCDTSFGPRNVLFNFL